MGYFVKDEYRTSPLSHRPGGFDVQIFFDKGPSRIYPRVKFPYKFWKESRENHPNIKGYKVLGISK
jgi:hypothetical protein